MDILPKLDHRPRLRYLSMAQVCFIRGISVASNAIQTIIDNDMIHLFYRLFKLHSMRHVKRPQIQTTTAYRRQVPGT